jgi:hypothetical protein
MLSLQNCIVCLILVFFIRLSTYHYEYKIYLGKVTSRVLNFSNSVLDTLKKNIFIFLDSSLGFP